MNRRNLLIGAVCSFTLISGVAWLGEYPRAGGAQRTPRTPEPDTVTVCVPPDPTEVVDVDETAARTKVEVVPVRLEETLETVTPPRVFTQPPEPVIPDARVEHGPVIPEGTGRAGLGGSPSYDLSQLDHAPVPRVQGRPKYPYSLRTEGVEGEVVVDFIVDPRGDVRNAVAARSSNHGFDDAACEAVSRWRFTPGRKGGRPVFVHMQVPIVFSLEGN